MLRRRLLGAGRGGVFVDDSFTGTDGTALLSHSGEIGSTTWARNNTTGSAAAEISDSNRVFYTVSGIFHPNALPAKADYWVEFGLYQKATVSGGSVFGGLRAITAATTGYFGGFVASGAGSVGAWTIGHFDNAAFTVLANPTGVTIANDTLYIVRFSVKGSILTLSVNGVIVATYNIAGSSVAKYYSKGVTAIRSSITATDTTGIHFDYIRAGY